MALNLEEVRDGIRAACRRADRDPGEVRLVAVAKGVRADRVLEAVGAGVGDVGENRAQELREKRRRLAGEAVRWHFLGAIQTNKVRYLDEVTLLHGLDRLEEAAALQRRGEAIGRTWDVLIEVNIAGEGTKHGIASEAVLPLLSGLRSYPGVRARGLMIVAPRAENAEDVRWVFALTRRLRDRLRDAVGGGLEELSMGMTEDYQVAIEEGATIVRVGRAIFREE